MMELRKESGVPLEEALTIAGTGWYTNYVMLVTGLVAFAALLGMQVMSIVIPAASCDLELNTFQKGLLTSMAFTGMIFSSHLFGFLADFCGRKKVMLACNLVSIIVTILSSLAPNAVVLMVFTFINGFVLGGVFTPSYVYVSEFCPQAIRSRGLLVCSAISSLATIYLPGVARIIMPLDIHIPLFGNVVYTSWRLYLGLLAVPNLVTNLLLRKLPETPKFVLNSGNEIETIDILQSIYCLNMKKKKEEYPIRKVSLDEADKISQNKSSYKSSKCFNYLHKMVYQTKMLFTQPFLMYTIISCVIMIGIVGSYNTVVLWIPENTKQLMLYADKNSHYNVTLCQVMSAAQQVIDENGKCEINYDIFTTSIIIGILQSVFFCIIGAIAHKISGKIIIVLFSTLTAGACFLLIYAQSFILTVSCLGTMVVLLLTMFPICLSIMVDFFPTFLRSTATSIIMLFGRIAAAAGSQVIGALFQSYCQTAYWGMTALLFCIVILTICMPSRRKL